MLTPLTFGELLDGAFAIYRRQFRTLVFVAAVCYGPLQLVTLYAESAGGWAENPWTIPAVLLLWSIGSLIGTGAIVRIVSDGYLMRDTTVPEALAFATGRMWSLMVAGFASYLLVFLGMLLLIVPGFIILCGYSVVAQVVVLESPANSLDSLGRSWDLTKGYRRVAFGLAVVLSIVASIPGFVAGLMQFSALALPALVIASIGAVILAPLLPCGLTLYYYDLRVRKEAFDLQTLEHLIAARV